MKPIRLLIAHSDPALEPMTAELSGSPSVEVVGVTSDGEEATALAKEHSPDIALVGGLSGGEARITSEIVISSPTTRVIAAPGSADRHLVFEMLRAGAVTHLPPSAPVNRFLETMEALSAGRLTTPPEPQVPDDEEAGPPLTEIPTEAEISSVLEGRTPLSIVFQPIFDLRRSRVVGLEALARFSQQGWRSPEVWFAEAARLGAGLDMETIAVRATLAQIGGLPPNAYVSVNVSPDFAASEGLAKLLEGSSPSRIVLELAEDAGLEDYGPLNLGLSRLRALGVRIALDDAGRDTASLNHVVSLVPDFIKLDRSVTRMLSGDPVRRTLVAGLMAAASSMRATLVAVGIEAQDALETVRDDLKVTHGQGFFLGRPPWVAGRQEPKKRRSR